MFKRILFPTDGSETSFKAFDEAVELAKKFDAEIVAVNVYDIPVHFFQTENTRNIIKEIEAQLKIKSDQILGDISKKLDEEGIRHKSISLKEIKGNPGYSIIYALEKEKCDLVVIGRRGLGTIKSTLLGSVSNYIINNTAVPVLLIN